MKRTPALLLALLLAACSAPSASPSTDAESPVPSSTESADGDFHGQLAFVAGVDPQIYLLDVASGESRQLTRMRPEHAELQAQGPMRPVLTCGFGPTALAWSPDGTLLAFAYGGCETVLYLVDLDGELTRVADGHSPAWSPDGSRLVFSPNTPFCMDMAGCGEPPEPGAWSLQVVDAAGGAEPVPLSLDPALVSAGQPHFSHDGTQIAFSGPLPKGEADPEIFGAAYAMAVDGGNPRLVARGAWSPGWLPDGRLLIVEEKTGDVHAIDLATGNGEALGGDAGPAVVSPDGSRMLLTRTDEVTGASGVRMATMDGDAVAALEGYPAAWAPDSSVAVVIESDEEETAMIFVGRDGEAIGRYAQSADTSFIGNVAWRPGS